MNTQIIIKKLIYLKEFNSSLANEIDNAIDILSRHDYTYLQKIQDADLVLLKLDAKLSKEETRLKYELSLLQRSDRSEKIMDLKIINRSRAEMDNILGLIMESERTLLNKSFFQKNWKILLFSAGVSAIILGVFLPISAVSIAIISIGCISVATSVIAKARDLAPSSSTEYAAYNLGEKGTIRRENLQVVAIKETLENGSKKIDSDVKEEKGNGMKK
jgi:hypothetical protein